MSRLATVLDRESPPKLESTDYRKIFKKNDGLGQVKAFKHLTFGCWCALLLVLISLLCELLLLWRFLTFRNILHHDDRIQVPSPAYLLQQTCKSLPIRSAVHQTILDGKCLSIKFQIIIKNPPVKSKIKQNNPTMQQLYAFSFKCHNVKN